MPHNLINFNPYKEVLSPFGRQVLDQMIYRWKQDNSTNKTNQYQQSTRFQGIGYSQKNQRTLTFDDSHAEINVIPLTFNDDTIFQDNTNVNGTSIKNDVTNQYDPHYNKNAECVPTSTELIETVQDKNEISHNLPYSREDLLQTPKIKDHRDSQIKINPEDENFHYCDSKTNNTENIEKEVKLSDSSKFSLSIKWDDMFDKDIFPSEENENNNIKSVEYSLYDRINKNDDNQNSKQINIISNEIVTAADLKKLLVKKRKSQKKITDSARKKVKKIPSEGVKKPTNSLNKEKYTETVENWLENIDTSHSDTDINALNTNSIVKEKKKLPDSTKNESIDLKKTHKIKPNKKVIQAQLANKNGIMKFKTPNTKTIEKNTTLETSDTIESRKIENVVKDKKSKSKFIAPIKSQIPVRDITFEIISLDSQNIEKYFNNFHELQTQSKEIVIILFYSNGFCQLNSQHTDDTCVAKGVIISFENTFYVMEHINFSDKTKTGKLFVMLLTDIKIICYEAKNLLIYLKTQFNVKININQSNIIDAKIGGYLLDPDNPPEDFTTLQKLLSCTSEYTIATECMLQKSAWYISLLKECADKLKSLLIDRLLWNVFINIEMRLLPLIADMELRGVNVDEEKLKSMESRLLNQMKEVEQECYRAAGKTFQINSAVQVRAILYDELKLDSKSKVKIRETVTTGAKSTSETMLRSLMSQHPLPKLILKYRHLHKAHATFVTGIAQHVKDGVVKPTWVQTAAATGRIASNNPNLQAIPKVPFSLDTNPDLTDKGDQLLNFRSVYVAKPGFKLLAADFQHIECRVFAHAAADTSLLEILRGDGDLFRVLASKWLKKPENEVSSEDRERTKRIVYASLYGAGTRKLMDILDVSYDQALSIVASFNRTFPSLKSFGRSVVTKCEENAGRLSTLCGRARHFKHITSNEFALKSHAERQAINFIVQGTAADLCKMAMILTEDCLRNSSPPIKGHLVLQIHDELVWEISDTDVERAADAIRNVMEKCGHHCNLITLKLPVALSYGANWGDMKKMIADTL